MKIRCDDQKTCKGRALSSVETADLSKVKFCPICGSPKIELILTVPDEAETIDYVERIKELNAHFCSHSVDGSCNLPKSEVKNGWKESSIKWRREYFNILNEIEGLEASLKDADADINKLNKDLIELEAQLKVKEQFLVAYEKGIKNLKKKLPSKKNAKLLKEALLLVSSVASEYYYWKDKWKEISELFEMVEQWLK